MPTSRELEYIYIFCYVYPWLAPRRIPMLLDWEEPVLYLVTLCARVRQPVLAKRQIYDAFLNGIRFIQSWTVRAAVIMPDHLHALVNPHDRDASVSAFSRLIKRSITNACPDRTWAWQQGCFDHLLRPTESASDKLAYMLVNPVRAGLVRSWRDWPYTYLSEHVDVSDFPA
jgi:REP-associated tyrosine transposase